MRATGMVRALVAAGCKLDLVSKSQRRGQAVGMYFGRYEALAAHVGGADKPAYFILLDWDAGQVTSIRDFRYVPLHRSRSEVRRGSQA